MTTSPFLLGAFAPVFQETTAVTFPVSGQISAGLNGLFTQIGPNPIRPPRHTDTDRYQWFAQDGMVSGVRLQDGTAQWFRNRWVRSTRVTRALGESRTPGRRHFPIGTVHTNVVSHAGLLLALVETGCTAVQLTPELDTVRYTDVNGTLPHGASAHPKFDPATGELHAIVYSPLRTFAEHRVLDQAGALLSSRRVDLGGRPMLHDIALTESHVVFFDLPVRFQIGQAVIGRFPYRWDDSYQPRIGILPRLGGGGVRWFAIEPCFLFHTVNATETGRQLTVKGIRYRRLFDSGAADPLTQAGQLWQWTIDLVSGAGRRRTTRRPAARTPAHQSRPCDHGRSIPLCDHCRCRPRQFAQPAVAAQVRPPHSAEPDPAGWAAHRSHRGRFRATPRLSHRRNGQPGRRLGSALFVRRGAWRQ